MRFRRCTPGYADVSPKFLHGPHKGQSVSELTRDLKSQVCMKASLVEVPAHTHAKMSLGDLDGLSLRCIIEFHMSNQIGYSSRTLAYTL